MKTIVAILALAAAASAQANTIETPIPNVYSLGTLTTDTGNPLRFTDGTFAFDTPIFVDALRLSVGVDTDGATTFVAINVNGDDPNLTVGPNSVYPNQNEYVLVGGLGNPLYVSSFRFYITSGGGPSAAFVNFPTTFGLSLLTTDDVPDTGSTSALLGIGALGLAAIKRKMVG